MSESYCGPIKNSVSHNTRQAQDPDHYGISSRVGMWRSSYHHAALIERTTASWM